MCIKKIQRNVAGIIRSSSPKFEKANTSSDDLAEAANKIAMLDEAASKITVVDDLAEAASKINLLSPAKLKPLVPNHSERPGKDY